MSRVDWSKAPEGSMCYVEGWGFFKCDNGEWWVTCESPFWQRTPYKSPENFSWFGDAVWRPSEAPTQWRGPQDGLPPVGTVCEFRLTESWAECEILAHYNDKIVAVAKETGTVGYIGLQELRAIETPEQKAARERDDSVIELHDVISGPGDCFAAARRVYDAGYRRIKK